MMTRKTMIWMSAALLALGVGLFSANTASAGWDINFSYGSKGFRGGNYGYRHPGFGYNRGYSNWGGRFDRGWYGRGGRGYNDCYRPPIHRHGDRFHILGGHRDHRGGHHHH